MYKIPMFPEGYKKSDNEKVRMALGLIDSNVGINQAVWPREVMAVADYLESAGALDEDILAGLIVSPLRGTTRFALADLTAQNIASAFIQDQSDSQTTLEQGVQRVLTSSPPLARLRLASMLQAIHNLPLPDTDEAAVAWYQVGHAVLYIAQTVAPFGKDNEDLLTPGLLAKLGDIAAVVLTAVRDIDRDEVKDIDGLRTQLQELQKVFVNKPPADLFDAKQDGARHLTHAELMARIKPAKPFKLK